MSKLNIELSCSEVKVRVLRSGEMVAEIEDADVDDVISNIGIGLFIETVGDEEIMSVIGSDKLIKYLLDMDIDVAGKLGVSAFIERFSAEHILKNMDKNEILEYIDSITTN